MVKAQAGICEWKCLVFRYENPQEGWLWRTYIPVETVLKQTWRLWITASNRTGNCCCSEGAVCFLQLHRILHRSCLVHRHCHLPCFLASLYSPSEDGWKTTLALELPSSQPDAKGKCNNSHLNCLLPTLPLFGFTRHTGSLWYENY